jgi:imidazolonepropionase-like amidohydrolase
LRPRKTVEDFDALLPFKSLGDLMLPIDRRSTGNTRALAVVAAATVWLASVAFLDGCSSSDHPTSKQSAPEALVLRGVTVVNTRDGSVSSNMDLTLDGGRIKSIESSGSGAPDASVKVINAVGKFVVPGYIDMHAHPLSVKDPSGSLELMLANGVTGFRQMSGSTELLKERRDGALPLPKDSPALLALPGSLLTPLNASSADMVIETIRQEKKDGADFIKVILVTPRVFFAALAEANRLDIPILGHLPPNVDVAAASKAGMKSIEHLGPGVGILAACSTEEARVRQQAAARPPLKSLPFRVPFSDMIIARFISKAVINPVAHSDLADVDILQLAISTFSEKKCRALAKQFVANGTWQVPTLIREKTAELSDSPQFREDPNLRYVAEATVQDWTDASKAFEQLAPKAKATFRDAYAIQLKLTKIFDEEGVSMLAGSDSSGAGWDIPGMALHQEFNELEKAGLSPLRVLQMTTLNAAEFLGKSSSLGTVEAGKSAELVLLDANPINSVQNLHKIYAVVRAGLYYSAAELDALKQKVQLARSVY